LSAAVTIVAVTSVILKVTWYDHLDVREARGKVVTAA
jgi:hypothetical protein